MDPKKIANERSMIRILKFNEWLWIFFSVVSIVITVYCIITGDRKSAIIFLIITFVSGFYYSFKKRLRKKREKYLEEQINK
ncbi:MAG: hypothetical protein Q8M29_04825 [Bacteroidota bacterium]|nr:hypothetical protein [Bacteroidota bacterium]